MNILTIRQPFKNFFLKISFFEKYGGKYSTAAVFVGVVSAGENPNSYYTHTFVNTLVLSFYHKFLFLSSLFE
jgi:hypothetical protein